VQCSAQSILSLTDVPCIVDELIILNHDQSSIYRVQLIFTLMLTLTRSELMACACCHSLIMEESPGDAISIILIALSAISRAKTDNRCEGSCEI
jgi:hypothetical protein